MSSRPDHRAFSLMEAILATFLLLTSLLLSIYVFHSGLRAEASDEKRVLAAAVAESALSEIRRDAGEDFRSLISSYDGKRWRLDEAPEFSLTCRARPATIGLACLELESQYPRSNRFPEPEPRMLERSAADVELEVSWSDPTPRSITVCERVASLREFSGFQVRLLDDSGAPAQAISLAKGATARFRAQAYGGGQPLDDLQFTWYVQPVQGFGSLTAISRDGLRCEYRNAYRNYNNRLRYAAGACYLTVTASFQGRPARDRVRIDNEP
jgi:hypothetical protein